MTSRYLPLILVSLFSLGSLGQAFASDISRVDAAEILSARFGDAFDSMDSVRKDKWADEYRQLHNKNEREPTSAWTRFLQGAAIGGGGGVLAAGVTALLRGTPIGKAVLATAGIGAAAALAVGGVASLFGQSRASMARNNVGRYENNVLDLLGPGKSWMDQTLREDGRPYARPGSSEVLIDPAFEAKFRNHLQEEIQAGRDGSLPHADDLVNTNE